MKLSLKIGTLLSTFILFQSTQASQSDWTLVHRGECLNHELTQGFKTGARWYHGGHAGPDLQEVCLKPKTNHLENLNKSSNSQVFVASGVAPVSLLNAKKLAKEKMWENAQNFCGSKKAFRVSETSIFDVGTFFAARAYFQCMEY